MENKANAFSAEDAKRLARSPAGRELLSALQQTDTAALDQALTLLQSGKTQDAKSLLQPLLQDPKIAAILRQFGG